MTDDEDEEGLDLELTTQFESSGRKMSFVRRPSQTSIQNVAPLKSANVVPEKHELEQSEKNLLLHPALEIEEDDEFVCDLGKSKKSETEFCVLAAADW